MAQIKTNAPRISVNKLAEFILAKGARQRQILHDQKYPTEFKGMYYREASEAISLSLSRNLEDLTYITKAISILEQATPDKIGTQRRIDSNIDALESFLSMLDIINLEGISAKLGENSPEKINIHNVSISVRPEIILKSSAKSKAPLVGAIKLHFPRTYSLSQDGAGYVSAILQRWCEHTQNEDGTVSGSLCRVIDVGAQSFYPGVKATVSRMKDVEAACQNIAALWPSI